MINKETNNNIERLKGYIFIYNNNNLNIKYNIIVFKWK